MVDIAPTHPWNPDATRRCLRGRVLVKVREGARLPQAPHYLETTMLAAPLHFDRGHIDRAIHRHSPAMQVTRAYHPCRAPLLGNPIDNTRNNIGNAWDSIESAWDSIERETGMARTYRIEVAPDTSLLSLIDHLRSLDAVEMATPHYMSCTPFNLTYQVPQFPHYGHSIEQRPTDPFYAQRMVGVLEALGFEPGDSAQLVGVIDSGVDLNHPEIIQSLRPGIDTVDLPSQILTGGAQLVGDTQNPDRIPKDEIGHGTACTSIIASKGLKLPPGLAGAAQIIPARALAGVRLMGRENLTAMGSLPDIDQAVKTIVDLGAKVLNLSFGTPATSLRSDDPQPHQDVIEYALRKGCILVAASGNDGKFNHYYPACHPGVLAIGSVGESGKPSPFSTRGDHVLLSAPGEKVIAATLGGEYKENTGTSFAAPFVAGACSLLVSRAARYGRPLDAVSAKSFLAAYARPFASGSDTRGCGAGVLDVPATLHGLERALADKSSRQGYKQTLTPLSITQPSNSKQPHSQPPNYLPNNDQPNNQPCYHPKYRQESSQQKSEAFR